MYVLLQSRVINNHFNTTTLEFQIEGEGGINGEAGIFRPK